MFSFWLGLITGFIGGAAVGFVSCAGYAARHGMTRKSAAKANEEYEQKRAQGERNLHSLMLRRAVESARHEELVERIKPLLRDVDRSV